MEHITRVLALEAQVLLEEGRRVLRTESRALELAAQALDEEFIRALTLLLNAEKVLLSGIGKSGIVARKLAATFSSTGTPAVFLHPVEALHGDLGIAGRRDCFLCISNSGSTDELLKIIPSLRSRGIPIIALLGKVRSPLAELADCVLNAAVEREACPLNLAPTTSTTVAMALGDALAVALMKERGFTIRHFAEHHPLGQLGRNLTLKVRDVMHTGAALPLAAPRAAFREVLIEMTAKALGCVIAVEGGRIAGIITDGDVRRALQTYDDMRTLRVADVMTTTPLTIAPDTLLGEALAFMENRERQISVLPVSGPQEELLGVVRVHDIVRAGL